LIEKRLLNYPGRIIGNPQIDKFNLDRQRIIDGIQSKYRTIITEFNKKDEAYKIADDAHKTISASAAVEVGALGLGALITILATSASADLTGILLAGFTAALGLVILPAKRKKLIKSFSGKIKQLRDNLQGLLKTEYLSQVQHYSDQIDAVVLPYSQFIHAESDEIKKAKGTIIDFDNRAITLKNKINSIH
jgi:hypothetical protein